MAVRILWSLAGVCAAVSVLTLQTVHGDSPPAKPVRLEGSSSCFRAVQACAEGYVEEHPNVRIQVRSGGSYGALENVLSGRTDVAYIEHPLRKYVDKLWEKNFPNGRKPAAEYVFALTALGIVVHKQNTLRALTYNQIRDIWSGKITDWGGVSDQNGEITVYTMQPSRHLGGSLLEHYA